MAAPPRSDPPSATQEHQYRQPKPFGFRLRETSNVYLDHSQYSDGFSFLTNIFSSGTSHQDAQALQTYVPLPAHIVIAATLSVHPLLTTRASNVEDQIAADDAIRFLRHTLQTLGSVNGRFAEAFVNKALSSTHRGSYWESRGARARSDSVSSEEGLIKGRLESRFANNRSLFSQVENIWQVVGWAFNCAVKHPARWQRWRLFLDFLVDLLEQDLQERVALDDQLNDGSTANVQGSICWTLFHTLDGRNERRRIMRAIFTDGSGKGLNEYSEVFKDETKLRRPPRAEDASFNMSSSRKELNLDEDKRGDYDDDGSDEDPPLSDNLANVDHDADHEPSIGEITRLQARMIAMLITLSSLPNNPFTHLELALDLLTEFIRPLELFHFTLLITSLSELDPIVFTALCANTLLPLLASPPSRIAVLALDQNFLIRHFLSGPANSQSPIDQARMSILVEHLLATTATNPVLIAPTPPPSINSSEPSVSSSSSRRSGGLVRTSLQYSAKLFNAVRNGVDARTLKAVGDSRKKSKGKSPEEEEAKEEVMWSGERIMAGLELLRDSNFAPPLRRDHSTLSSSLSPAPDRDTSTPT